MGIHGLTKLIGDHAPAAIRTEQIQNLFNRKIAIDASMSIYQFVIGIRGTGMDLTNESGEITSHLQGLLSRTVRLVENGIRPLYVFDGKPPELKQQELERRKASAAEAKEKLENAENVEDEIKFGKRTVRVTKEQNEDAKRLLTLLGVPIIDAPCEAEAQCSFLAKTGFVWAAGSEDMDTLTYGCPVLVRNLTFSQANLEKKGVMIIDHAKALEGLGLTEDQFVDLCILCGCDYAGTIKGIGPTRALKLVQEHGSIEKILANLDTAKNPPPEPFPYQEIRELFRNPDVVRDKEELGTMLKWKEVDVEGLVEFLCKEKGFNEERVRSSCSKLKSAKTSGKGSQNRIDQFFKMAPATSSQPGAGGKKAAPSGKLKAQPPAKKSKR